MAKQKELDEDPTQEDPVIQPSTPSVEDPTYSEPTPTIKTVTMEDGRMCEIAGDQASGFEIRYGNRRLPSRFKDLDQAELALEMFKARCRSQNQSADYIDEA